MAKYIFKRIIMAIVTIFAVASVTFFVMNMVPGGPFMSEKAISPQAQAALNEKYGLDKPLSEQYVTYMKDLLHGNLGLSVKQRGRTVNMIIASKFPVSARVGGIAILTAVLVGVPLGSIAAFKRGTVVDDIIIVFSTCGIAIPSFVICTILMYVLSLKLGLLPTYGLASWKNYIMPVIALALYPSSYIARLMRAYTVTGSFIVEKIFTIPGLGSEFIGSITGRDYPLIMGTTIFLASLMVVMNVIVDVAYKFIDPRINLK